MKYNRLTIVREFSDYPYSKAKTKTKMVECVCDCGNIVIREKAKVINGKSKSCGCFKKEIISKKSSTHGLRKDEAYPIYNSMIWRCENPKNPRYNNYGGRGIKICEEWRDVKTFIEWCHNNGFKKGLQLDRIDVNGNYEPSNCRFVTSRENSMNRRDTVIKDGIVLKEWLLKISIKYNVNKNTLHTRYYSLLRKGYKHENITEDMILK